MLTVSMYMSLLIDSSIANTFKLQMFPWQRSEIHRNTTFSNFGSIFHHLTSFTTTGPRDKQFLIMKFNYEVSSSDIVCKVSFCLSCGLALKN